MPVERSAGAIIARDTPQGRLYLLLQHYPGIYSRNQTKKKKEGHWDFPKGHVEKGEGTLDTVRREVMKEAGILSLDFIEGFRETIKYYVGPHTSRRPKFVIFLLASTDEKKVTISHEHQNFKWLPFDEAYKLATYQETKKLLKKANDFLRTAGI